MTGVLICTHGNSATELLKSAEMICGKQDNCQTVKFEMGEELDELLNDLDQKIGLLSNSIICLTDLKGGTPFNMLIKLVEKYPNMEIITGVNIPMLLELFINRSQVSSSKLIDMIVEAGKTGIYRYCKDSSLVEDEEF
ncbi:MULTISPECIES: PTS sugar transporter subunit IIA [unclassified Lactobacillus]|uniref:PTS sugar transporter subunit IIA n=1 Tax=unclassified Lactobacillus TaxID=2620435 RepID=UPI000EFA9C39|nr:MULTISPECIES: PTS sugar transporter subunit IIA [unclassified Lactobacillus]RMC23640.1 PTS sugar transporter subunit IIA [Lactobacillus sp. ESL0247]RMC27401.1 PTS sugar transporter subunit IIA [Lactobacillus sp. ESL0246]RMC30602.1 PTS sugar transporter subunit IIA [Lactobacillus sp. ESL0245]RMC47686.1 PTS sugar transporter subunit IIA [Lactobacillus sp. ESL0228]